MYSSTSCPPTDSGVYRYLPRSETDVAQVRVVRREEDLRGAVGAAERVVDVVRVARGGQAHGKADDTSVYAAAGVASRLPARCAISASCVLSVRWRLVASTCLHRHGDSFRGLY